jgi:hypothetical protein
VTFNVPRQLLRTDLFQLFILFYSLIDDDLHLLNNINIIKKELGGGIYAIEIHHFMVF